jgi:hypothetical protein
MPELLPDEIASWLSTVMFLSIKLPERCYHLRKGDGDQLGQTRYP